MALEAGYTELALILGDRSNYDLKRSKQGVRMRTFDVDINGPNRWGLPWCKKKTTEVVNNDEIRETRIIVEPKRPHGQKFNDLENQDKTGSYDGLWFLRQIVNYHKPDYPAGEDTLRENLLAQHYEAIGLIKQLKSTAKFNYCVFDETPIISFDGRITYFFDPAKRLNVEYKYGYYTTDGLRAMLEGKTYEEILAKSKQEWAPWYEIRSKYNYKILYKGDYHACLEYLARNSSDDNDRLLLVLLINRPPSFVEFIQEYSHIVEGYLDGQRT